MFRCPFRLVFILYSFNNKKNFKSVATGLLLFIIFFPDLVNSLAPCVVNAHNTYRGGELIRWFSNNDFVGIRRPPPSFELITIKRRLSVSHTNGRRRRVRAGIKRSVGSPSRVFVSSVPA